MIFQFMLLGQLILPAPENVTACVAYEGNRTLLNVRWQPVCQPVCVIRNSVYSNTL